MDIKLFTIGKLKDDFYRATEHHYQKLLSSFCRLEIVELKDEKILKNSSVSVVVEKEGERIIDALQSGKKTIALDAKGKQYSSEEFAAFVQQHKDTGVSLQFVIGGPYGLSNKVKEKVDEKLSLSSFTFPHQLARIVLLEQLYRGFTIMKGKRYHY